MGAFVEGIERLVRATGATVIVVHHTAKGSGTERGSGALRGAADVMILVSTDEDEGCMVLRNNKQKDEEEFKEIRLKLHQIRLEGADLTSCVLLPSEANASDRANESGGLASHLIKTLQALDQSPGGTASVAQWRAKAGAKDKTLHTHRAELVAAGYVERERRGRYRITDSGKAVLATSIPATAKFRGARPGRGTAATATNLQLVNGGS